MSADEEVKWEDPPLLVGGRLRKSVWVERLAPLRDRPGQWANLGTHHVTVVPKINRGQLTGIEEGEFEATSRGIGTPGKGTIYVRYVGRPNLTAVPEAAIEAARLLSQSGGGE